MELKDFVRESLSQVMLGVLEAQDVLQKEGRGGEVSPPIKTDWTEAKLLMSPTGMPVQNVEFDIAVVATEKTGTKGTVGVGISVFKLGAGGSSQESSSQTSRIKFSVPITLPPMSGQNPRS